MSGAAEGIAGLTLSAVSVTALFITCIECYSLVVAAREFGEDYELLCTELSLQKLRFFLWGESVGLASRIGRVVFEDLGSWPDWQYTEVLDFRVTPVQAEHPTGAIKEGFVRLKSAAFRLRTAESAKVATALLRTGEVHFPIDINLDDQSQGSATGNHQQEYFCLIFRSNLATVMSLGDNYDGLLLQRLPADKQREPGDPSSYREPRYIRRGIWQPTTETRKVSRSAPNMLVLRKVTRAVTSLSRAMTCTIALRARTIRQSYCVGRVSLKAHLAI